MQFEIVAGNIDWSLLSLQLLQSDEISSSVQFLIGSDENIKLIHVTNELDLDSKQRITIDKISVPLFF